MKNFLIRLFLSLCLVLLSGYSQLYGQPDQSGIYPSSTKHATNLGQASFANAQKSLALLSKTASSNRKKVAFKLKAIEVEEEEEEDEHAVPASKKYSESNYFSATFWAQTLSYFFCCSKKILPVGKHSFYIPSPSRHLLFQVFRI
jgi:hypothetical protein